MFFKIGILKNFTNFTGLEFLCNKVAGPRACNVIKNGLQHKHFPYDICKLLKNNFFTEHLWWLLLKIINSSRYLRVFPVVAKKLFNQFFCKN